MSWASKHKHQPEILCDGNIKNTTNLLTTNVSSTMDVHNNRISLQRSCQNNRQQNQNSSTTIMNWRSKRKIISRQKYHQDKHRIMSQNNNNFSPITNNYNSEKCNRSTTVSSKSTKSAQVSYSSCKQTAESNPSHCNVSQSSPSPYLFHFLVLVLITFAHCAGKILL